LVSEGGWSIICDNCKGHTQAEYLETVHGFILKCKSCGSEGFNVEHK
jgi:hypothetical protein